MLQPRKAFIRRRAIVRHRRYTGPTRKIRKIVHERSGGVCEFVNCQRIATDLHHRKPRRMGGRAGKAINQPANLMHVCRVDHDWLEEHRADAYETGWLLREHEDAEAVPVALSAGMFLLDNDGGKKPLP
jgi:hypothetical protein